MERQVDGSAKGLLKGLGSLVLAKMNLNITIASLQQGQHIECKDLGELLECEEAIMTVRLPSMLVAVGFLLAACAPGAAAPSASAPPAAATAAPARAAPTSGPAPAAAAPVERQVIRYGHNPILAGAPLYLALERGYFAEQGFDMELTPFDSGTAVE